MSRSKILIMPLREVMHEVKTTKKMLKTISKYLSKYLIIILLVAIYINRGLFVASAPEMENRGGGEINSVIELAWKLITGECNNIDEDGDLQANNNTVKGFQYDFSQYFSFLDSSLPTKNLEKNRFPKKEELPVHDFYFSIDQPPEIV